MIGLWVTDVPCGSLHHVIGMWVTDMWEQTSRDWAVGH